MADLTPERAAAILDAYGADPRRWPEAERAAMLARLREAGEAMLDEAGALDDLLDAGRAPAPSMALRAAVLAGAPRRAIVTRARLWWAGLILTAATAAGALSGSAAAAAFAPLHLPGYSHQDATAFGAVAEAEE
jgi:hypothetical protein